ncbi:MAG: hypothetical protein KGH63_02100, partial [Candidatus Micrarchaeota archaeon]|nr:hypothetical protein [Candidatus Micrarchaeota archaeon]
MGGSSRGYVSFLLLVQWAYLVLIPYLAAPVPTHSLLPAYAAQRAVSEQAAFKRAARQSAADAFRQLKADSSVAKLAAQLAGVPPQAFGRMTRSRQEQAARAFIVARWASLSAAWSSQSGFGASLSCPPFPDCGSSIHLSPDGRTLSIDGNILAALQHRSLNLSITSTLAPGDVDS